MKDIFIRREETTGECTWSCPECLEDRDTTWYEENDIYECSENEGLEYNVFVYATEKCTKCGFEVEHYPK